LEFSFTNVQNDLRTYLSLMVTNCSGERPNFKLYYCYFVSQSTELSVIYPACSTLLSLLSLRHAITRLRWTAHLFSMPFTLMKAYCYLAETSASFS